MDKNIYELNSFEIIIGIKNTWFGLLDDILDKKFDLDIITKSNRMFFIGITLIVVVFLLYIIE